MAKGKNQAKQAAAKAAEREAIRAENQEARYKDELKRSENLIRQREKEIETTQRLGSAELKQEEAILRHMKAQEALYELMASQKELIGEDLEAKKALTIAIEGQTKKTEKARKAQEDYNQEVAEGDRIAKNYGNALFGISGVFGDLYTKFLPKTKGGFVGLAKSIGKSLITFQVFKDAAVGMIGASVNLAFAQDKATSAFRQATGAGKQYNNVIADIERSNAAAGVTIDDAGQATLSLFNSYRDFTNLSDAEKKNVGSTVALMNELGVSSGTSAKIMDQATKSLGMASGESEEILRTLASTAKQIGKPMSEVAEDFASAAPKLAFYGKDMIGVFQKLEQQSKSTGMSVDELLGIVGDPFDTFEGAGQKVGRLNAILGGPYLNSIDMLNASEEERLELIKQSIDAAGAQINMMSKQEQQALANAAGMTVDQLRRSMGALSDEEMRQAISQEKLAALAAETKSVLDELKNAFRSLIVENRELFEAFTSLVTKFSTWLKQLDKGEVKLAATILLYGAIAIKIVNVAAALQKLKIIGGITKLWGGAIKVMKLWRAAWILTNTTMTATPIGAILAAAGILMALFTAHIMKARKAGMEWGAIIWDLAEKLVLLTGPFGLVISPLISFIKHLTRGKSAADALVESLKDLANNMSFGLAGKLLGFGTNIERAKTRKTNDVIVTTGGEVIEPAPDDTIMAGKPGGPIAKAFGGLGAMAASGPMGMIMGGALRQIIGPILKEAITDPVVAALTGATQGGGQQKQDINIVVKIGEKELNDQIITALNSPQGAMAISPFYQG